MGEISVKTGNNARNGGKNSLNRLIRCVCGKKIGPDPRNFNQRVSLGRNDLLIRTFPNRPVLKELITVMKSGDELIVWKLDRIGRNVLHALLMFQNLHEKGVNFRSITDGVDLKTASGRYNFRNILSAAQYESDLNSERTLAGLAIARSKGRIGGRRPKFSDEQWQQMGALIAAGKSRRYVARIYNVGLSTLYKRFPVTGIQMK
ncbi:recombinase family protein [Escherichia coli]|uniref:recombinase family protein n=2 Tax=Enterobacteriaceae TaxID=543 RepID=UPI00226E01CC|nr:recombinase family protein [Escherichia coli]